MEIKRPTWMSDERWEHFRKTQQLLLERIAYHESKTEEEKRKKREKR
jgi:hypothetical protein